MKEYEYTGKAMGTEYAISIVCSKKETADILAAEAISEIQSYENRFSRFLPNSELSQLNTKKCLKVSETFMQVTKRAYELYLLTQGMFNPLVQISRFGYNKNFDDISNQNSANSTDKYNIDFNTVNINNKTSTITLQNDQMLDFGGFLKGYLAELLCKRIKESSSTIMGAIVNIGGDIHSQGSDEFGKKFSFDIYNPITKSDDVSIELYNQSLATSGTYKRVWKINDVNTHHILDASGISNPDSEIISASVICENGAKAEAFAKVLISTKSDAIKNADIKDLSYILIKKDGSVINKI